MIRIKNYFFTLMLFSFCQQNLLAQNPNHVIDSLLAELKTAKEDTSKTKTLNALSEQLWRIRKFNDSRNYADSAFVLSEKLGFKKGIWAAYRNIGTIYRYQDNYTEALKNFQAALKISEELGDKWGISGSYGNIGNIYITLSNYPEALKNFQAALKIRKEMGDKSGIASLYNGIGVVYSRLDNYSEALKNNLASLKIMEEIGNKNGIAESYNNIGLIYFYQGNFPEALKNYLAALKIQEELGNKESIAAANNNIGLIYESQGNYPEALKNYQATLKISEETGIKRGIAYSYRNIGTIYKNQGNYPEALKNHFASLKISEEMGDKDGIASSYISIGLVFSRQVSIKNSPTAQLKYNEALQYFNKGLLLAKEVGSKKLVKDAYEGLAEAYIGMKDYKKALEYNNLYVDMKDSLINNETTRKLEQQRTQYEIEKAVAEEKLQQEKVLVEQKFQNEKKLAEENTKYQLALAEEQAKKKKALEIAKLKYDFALATSKTEEEKMLATQQFENETKLAEENARHQQALADEKARQMVKDAEAGSLLEKEKAAKKRRTEGYTAGLIGLALISIFTIVIIRQRNLKRRAVDKAETGHKMAELELQSLRAQLNPHFMFNSLNAIQDLILKEDNDRSHLYLSRFSKLLRMLLDNANQPFVSVKQEMEFLELYLSLENLRIPDLKFSIEKDPKLNTEERMVPNMMLQPYIENAIWHGLSNKKGDRKLQIRIHENGNATEFEIEDNGIGRKKAAELKNLYRKGHTSKGMELLSKRFNLLSKEYGATIKTTITDLGNNEDGTGTLVKIDVPFSLSDQTKQLTLDTNHNN